MGIKIQNFNRIIDIYFLNEAGTAERVIKCPRKGRKPNIEINGNIFSDFSIPAFNLTIKNLYLDTKTQTYPKIKVVAGYENDTTEIIGTILTIYQESPGPEGTTVIQCIQGNMENWLNRYVQIEARQGEPLATVMAKLAKALGMYGPRMGVGTSALTLKQNFLFDGLARIGITQLQKYFENEGLTITQRNNVLCAFSLFKSDFLDYHKLEFVSAPPQQNTGDEGGSYYTTVTAPWIPKLSPGDMLEIPQWMYVKNFTLVGNKNNKQIIVVTTIQFHFSTTSGANSMTVQGYKAK